MPKETPEDKKSLLNLLLNGLLIFGTLATILTGVIVFLSFVNPRGVESAIVNFYNIVTPTPETQLIVVTQPPLPTYTPQPDRIIVVTATSVPATQTTTPVPIQGAGFVFQDDFESSPDSRWETKFGNPGMANGKFAIIDPFSEQHSEHLAVLNDLYWGDYSLTFELAPFEATGIADSPHAAILLRYVEGGDSVGFYFSGDQKGVQFGIYTKEGEWQLISSSLVEGFDNNFNLYQTNTIRIDSVGDTYTAFINGKRVTSISVAGQEFGQIGVWFLNGTFSSSRIFAHSARIEYITIESLP